MDGTFCILVKILQGTPFGGTKRRKQQLFVANSSRSMPQFLTSMATHTELADESRNQHAAENSDELVRHHSAALSHMEEIPSEEAYIPVNSIPPEALAVIAAWESFNMKSIISSDRMEIDETATPVSLDTVEHSGPPSYLHLDPPKRYCRTFWRSFSRRVLALSSTRNV